MSKCPCGDCENNGCGSYHDKCEKYNKWKNEYRNSCEYNKNMAMEVHQYFNS